MDYNEKDDQNYINQLIILTTERACKTFEVYQETIQIFNFASEKFGFSQEVYQDFKLQG